jgi:hypothetical protein
MPVDLNQKGYPAFSEPQIESLQLILGDGVNTKLIADVLEAGLGTADLTRVQSSVSGALALSSSNAAANSTAILAKVAAGQPVVLPAGVYPISPIDSTLDINISGAGSKLSVLYSAVDAAGYLIRSTGRLELERIGIRGLHNTAKGSLTTAVGTQSGVQLDARTGSGIRNCEVYGFGLYGVGFIGDTTANDRGPVVESSFLYNNFAGIDTGSGDDSAGLGEYAKILGNTFIENTYGAIVRTGNINISGANSFQFNGENIYVKGGSNNGAHGVITGNLINHAYRRTINIEGVVYGQVVTNNTMFSNTAEILMTGCKGVQFNGNLIFASLLTFNGASWNSFADNVFYGAMPTIADTSGTRWRDNYSLAANDYTSGKFSAAVDTGFIYTPGFAAQGANLVTNGDFTSASGWTQQSGWAVSSGIATATNCSSLLFSTLIGGNLANTIYQIDFDLTCTAGNMSAGIGGSSVSPTRYSTNGHVTIQLNTLGGTGGAIYIVAYAGFTGTVDNVVVKKMVNIGDMSTSRTGASDYLYVGSTKYFSGTGSPEGAVVASIGCEYTRTDGTAGTSAVPGTLKYIKTSGAGNTGWTAIL